MKVLVTGVSGAIGGAAARALLNRGHRVIGTVTSAGREVPEQVETLVADLFDPAALTSALADVDAVVHAASSNDERAGELDRIVAETVLDAFAGTGKAFVYTSGIWVHGHSGETALTEESPLAPPLVVSWRPAVEKLIEETGHARGVRTVRIRPGLVYGAGKGYPAILLAPQQTPDGPVVRHFGDGSNRWPVVHVDDLGELYALAVESAPAGSVYLAALDESVRVADAARAVAERHGAQVADWNPEDAQQYWGVMVEAFMLDQLASAAKARTELGWTPTRPGRAADLTAS
ncbi:NAD-dependent epimerase/dehydratase family protein [Nocardia yamanashiensis]|uniref:NAD-dependent epimerase/dehydratase family protein n=1 Tax=Nocardia yamanashiensis TaxID=209247 RepID=UPI000830E739|nr:NAD-dependent epimerase/dehydratase family protein [Nocardia yamanashiensis]